MTENTIDTDAAAKRPFHGPASLVNVVAGLLAPMFLAVSDGDFASAQRAAVDSIEACGPQDAVDLIAVAQMLAFGLAALDSLSQSVAADMPLLMALRLRSNANACHRAAEQIRRTRAGRQRAPEHQAPAAEPDIGVAAPVVSAEPDPLLSLETEDDLAAEAKARLARTAVARFEPRAVPAATRTPAERQSRRMWAIAMAKESSEITAGLATLPPAERSAAAARAAMLSATAHDLVCGSAGSPGSAGMAGALPPH